MNQLRKLQQFNLLKICLQANRPASYAGSRSFHQLVNDDRRRNQRQSLASIAARSGLIQTQRRFKSKKTGKGKEDDESDSESDSEEESDTDSSEEDSDLEDSNIKKIETINTRLDMVMKNGKYQCAFSLVSCAVARCCMSSGLSLQSNEPRSSNLNCQRTNSAFLSKRSVVQSTMSNR